MNSALCIGINNYPGVNSDLSGCVNDAMDWAAALTARGIQTRILLDQEATKAAIVDAMCETVASTGYGQTGVITYSGHGTWVPDQDDDESDARDEALCPYDIHDARLITDDELAVILDNKNYGSRLVMISDSCHSGTVTRLARAIGDSRTKVRFLPPAMFLDPAAVRRGEHTRQRIRSISKAKLRASLHVLMAGCADHEYSYDAWFDGRANGAFTYVALQALAGLGDPTFVDWMGEIRKTLPSQDYPQTPQLSGRVYMRRKRLAG